MGYTEGKITKIEFSRTIVIIIINSYRFESGVKFRYYRFSIFGQ